MRAGGTKETGKNASPGRVERCVRWGGRLLGGRMSYARRFPPLRLFDNVHRSLSESLIAGTGPQALLLAASLRAPRAGGRAQRLSLDKCS